MNRNIKSILWALTARGYDPYLNEDTDDFFVANILKCSECGKKWEDTMDECFFCGDLRYGILACSICSKEYSPQGRKTCETCIDPNDPNGGHNRLKTLCINPRCNTRTNITLFQTPHKGTRHEHLVHNIQEMANFHEVGVFGKETSFSLSVVHCTNCGNDSSVYELKKIFVYSDTDLTKFNQFVQEKNIVSDDVIIFVKTATFNPTCKMHYHKRWYQEYDFCIYDGNIPNVSYQFSDKYGLDRMLEQLFMT